MIVEALRKIESAGFHCDERDGQLIVTNGERLTDTQRDWIRAHKDELLRQIVGMRDPNVKLIVELFDADVINYERLCNTSLRLRM